MKKRIISLVLAMAMCLSIVACGGDKTVSGNKVNNAASKEGVFDIVDLETIAAAIENDEFNINQLRTVGDTLYMVADVYLTNGNQVRYITADMDGNIKSNTVIFEQIWEDYGVTDGMAVGRSESDVVSEVLVASAAEGVVTFPMIPEEVPATGGEEEENVWHNMYAYVILSDGKLAYVDSFEKNNHETGMYEITNYIVVCDETGTELSKTNINEGLDPEEYIYVNTIVESEANSLYVLCGEKIFEVAIEGGVAGTIEPNDVTKDLYGVSFYKDGYPVFSIWNEDYTEQKFKAIDIRKGAVIEEVNVPKTLSNFSIYDGTNSGYDLVLANNMGIYGYNFGDTEPKELMNYINSNLATYRVRNVCFKDSDNFIAMYNDIADYKNHVASFKRVAPENVPDRKVLTMATYGVDMDVTKTVIEYNRNSDQYKILVKDYSQYATNEDWYAGTDRLNNDIISGNVPDIINCSSGLPIANYASKGLLVDIYELMDKDETIHREDYAENVFKAYEMDGKLYELPTKFYVWTVYGKTDVWGDKTAITWEDVAAVQAKYPNAQLFSDLTKSRALSESLRFSYGKLVDEGTGECHFDSELFKSILEYANTYPEEINYDELYNDNDYWLNYQYQYMQDRTLLAFQTIYSIYDAWSSMKRNFNAEVTPVGFPTDEGQGSVVSAVNSYAISAKSPYVDGAWDFVKAFISEENQLLEEDADRYSFWGLPIMKKGIEQQANYITQKPYYMDQNGNKVEYDDYIYIGDQEILIEPATEEEAQEWVDFILSVDKKASSDYEKAMEIITEEADAYFKGQKKVEDVMSIIQSRMDIFINVNR